ncbi:hypothetical protein DFH28DRAFT_1105575 [Melampsora americana]|nr:hypothetical protein DFH28DRAFT_1105575 [Melampsora americana]
MSAQEYADDLAGIELNTKSSSVRNSSPKGKKKSRMTTRGRGAGSTNEGGVIEDTRDGNDHIEDKSSNMVEKDTGTIIETERVSIDQRNPMKELESGKGGELGSNEQMEDQNMEDREIEIVDRLINAPVNEGDNSRGKMTGLGRSTESMNEPVLIELTHKKWIHNLHSLAYQGNIARYDLIQREYEKWCSKNQTQVRKVDLFEMDVDLAPLPILNVMERPKDIPKSKRETNTKMEFGELLGNHMTGLSPYWNEIMINKNIHMPVSIFDPTWLLQDANYIRRKTKTSTCQTDTSTYTGSPVMNEYRLTFAEWLVRFNLMIKYQELKYDILENQKDSPIAPSNGGMADVGTLDKRLLEQAERDAKHFGDYYYVDNPYAFGGPMQHVSPLDGIIYPENKSWDTAGVLIDTHVDMIAGRSLPVWNNQTATAEKSSAGNMSPITESEELEARRIRESNLNATLRGRKTRSGKRADTLRQETDRDPEEVQEGDQSETEEENRDQSQEREAPKKDASTNINIDINIDDDEGSVGISKKQKAMEVMSTDESSSEKGSSDNEKDDNAYAAGRERENYNPLNGRKYLYGKNHNSAEGSNISEQSNLTVPENRGYQGNRRNNRGKGFNRSVSPYQKPEDREKDITGFKKNFSHVGRGGWKSYSKGEGSSKDVEKPVNKE